MTKNRAFVLPSLLLITIVLLTLATALLASGTSGLRVATHDQQTDQALYAAEAGLSIVSAKLVAGNTQKYFEDDLGGSESRYEVHVYSNDASTEKLAYAGGPVIPPQTAYVLAEGFSRNNTRRKSGALFSIGLQAFKVGALGREHVSIENSSFDAFNGADGEYDPSKLEVSLPLLATNQSSGPTFTFTNAHVAGDIFLGPGGSAASQVTNNSSTLGNIKPMASTIDLEDVELPDPADDDDDPVYVPPVGALAVVSVDVNGVYHFSDGKGIEFSVDPSKFDSSNPTAHITVGPGMSVSGDDDPLEITINGPGGSGHFAYFNNSKAETYYRKANEAAPEFNGQPEPNALMDAVLFGDPDGLLTGPSTPSDVVNPSTLKPGSYDSVSIEDGFGSKLSKNGLYIIDSLHIEDGSSLGLPADAEGATIYVTGSLKVSGKDAILNLTRRAPKLKIFYTGNQPVNLAGGSSSFFTLVAQDAEIVLDSAEPGVRTQFFGAMVGRDVTVRNADFHFDTSTAGIGTGTVGTSMTLLHHHRL